MVRKYCPLNIDTIYYNIVIYIFLKILNDPIKVAEEKQKERKEEIEGKNSNWKFSSSERIPKNQLNCRRRMESENNERFFNVIIRFFLYCLSPDFLRNF